MTKLFSSGTIEVTPAASAALQTAQVDLMRLLSRHQRGDWGDVDEFRRRMNERAIQNRIPISSVYALGDDTKILIITARDRS